MGVVGVANGVGNAGIRDTGHIVHIRKGALLFLLPSHDLTVADTHDLHIFALVVGVGVAVVGPQEGADLHLVPGGRKLLHAVGGDFHDFAGAQLVDVLVAQLVVGKGLKGDTAAVGVLAHQNRQATHLVPGGDDAVGGQQQDGAGAVDDLLGIVNAVHQIVAAVDKGCRQLRGVHLTGGHGHKLMAGAGEGLFHQLVGVVDPPYGGDGEQTQMRPDQQGLRVGIGDGADTGVALEFGKIRFKLGAERGVFDIVNLALEAQLLVVDCHAAPACAQVGMVVGAEKDIVNAVFVGDGSEETAHGESSLSIQHISCRLRGHWGRERKMCYMFCSPGS